VNNKDFEALVNNRLKECRETLFAKGEEYSSDIDRLHNFKIAARIDGITPEKALWGMYRKHLVSVMDLKNNPYDYTPELVKEKIGDSINYHLLLEALLVERMSGKCVGTVTLDGKWKKSSTDAIGEFDQSTSAAEPNKPNLISNPIE